VKNKARIAKVMSVAQVVHRYGSLEGRLPPGSVEKMKAKTPRASKAKGADDETPVSQEKLHYSYGL